MLDSSADDQARDPQANTRFDLRRLVFKLAKASQLFPSKLYFHSLKVLQSEPVSGGAYADIYLATDCSGVLVAVKRMRTFQTIMSTAWGRNQQVRDLFHWMYNLIFQCILD